MGKDSKARGLGALDQEDGMKGQFHSRQGSVDFPSRRRTRVHDSVGGSPREAGSGSSIKTLVHGQSWLAMESLASRREQGGPCQRDARGSPIRETGDQGRGRESVGLT